MKLCREVGNQTCTAACLTGAQASEVLSCLGLSAGSLTAVGQKTLAYIAGIAHSLQLQGCEKYMFLVALIELGDQQHELQCAQVTVGIKPIGLTKMSIRQIWIYV